MSKQWMAVLVVVVFAFSLHAARPQRKTSQPPAKPQPALQTQSAQQQVQAPDSVTQLANDLAAIKSGSSVTKAQKEALANDLLAMADGATKPDQALVDDLVDDLYAALEDGAVSTKEAMKLAADLEAVMNSANIPKSEVDKAIADAQAILLASGVTKEDVQVIVKDLQAIAADLQGKQPATSAPRPKRRG